MNDLIFVTDRVDQEQLGIESYNKAYDDMMAIAAANVYQVNLDVRPAVITGLGTLPKLLAHEEEIYRVVPDFDRKNIKWLETYAMATSYAHTRYLTATQSSDDLPERSQEAVKMREVLRADTYALVARGLINPETLEKYKGTTGYKVVANDDLILVSVLRDHWKAIQGKCAVTQEELDRTEKLANHILRLIGLREQAPAVIAAAADMRARAFTLYVRAYDQDRRAMTYLRWDHGDVDTIIPSLYAGKSRRPPEEETPEIPEVSPESPVEPKVIQPVKPGYPGSNPFME